MLEAVVARLSAEEQRVRPVPTWECVSSRSRRGLLSLGREPTIAIRHGRVHAGRKAPLVKVLRSLLWRGHPRIDSRAFIGRCRRGGGCALARRTAGAGWAEWAIGFHGGESGPLETTATVVAPARSAAGGAVQETKSADPLIASLDLFASTESSVHSYRNPLTREPQLRPPRAAQKGQYGWKKPYDCSTMGVP